jgi:uncharacterized protein
VLFAILIVFALLGNARVFFFVANRLVFGPHREERSPFHWMLRAVPIALVVLTLLGGPWMLIAATIGVYWVADRTRVLLRGEKAVAGTRTLEPEIVRLRKAHIPFAWLRNLGAHNDVYDLELTRHEVFIDGLPPALDGYRIAFVTDTHVASFMRRGLYREVVAQIARFDPDLVLLGGDFVSFRRHIPLMAEVLDGLAARDGVYACLGNHDYWADRDGVIAALTAKGVEFVINRSIVLRDDLTLTGIDEVYRGEPDLDASFAKAGRIRLGLSHHPDIVDLFADERLDLLVCGHTHGGQIRFPFFGSVVVPSKHEGRYANGFHRVANVLMYVSRGIGAIPPLRILCKPELATFVLRPSIPSSP